MPLIQGYSKASIAANIAAEVRAGRSRSQAVAIAYETARKAWRKTHSRAPLPAHLRTRKTGRPRRLL